MFRVKSRLVYQITKIEVATIADGWFPTGGSTVLSTIIVAVKPKINCKSNVWLYIDYISNLRRSNWSRWMKIRWEIASSDRTFHVSCKWGQFFLWADKPISCVNERELIRNAVSLILSGSIIYSFRGFYLLLWMKRERVGERSSLSSRRGN